MKILYISSYPAWEEIKKDEMPKFHLFGMAYLVTDYQGDERKTRAKLKDWDGFVDFRLKYQNKRFSRRVNQFITMLLMWVKSFRYDVVYDPLDQCTKFLAFMKKHHLMKAKLISVLHHPSWDFELRKGVSDAYIFFDNAYVEYAKSICPEKSDRYFVCEWWPDKDWYYRAIQRIDDGSDVNDYFIDNGKTNRDHILLSKAANECKVVCIMPEDAIPLTDYVQFYTIDLKDNYSILKKVNKALALVIPNKKTKQEVLGPFGITSFMDALALNKPIICSDNCCFAHYVKDNGLGIVYSCGSQSELEAAIKKMCDEKTRQSYIEHIKVFVSDKDSSTYGKQLKRIIENVLKKEEYK